MNNYSTMKNNLEVYCILRQKFKIQNLNLISYFLSI